MSWSNCKKRVKDNFEIIMVSFGSIITLLGFIAAIIFGCHSVYEWKIEREEKSKHLIVKTSYTFSFRPLLEDKKYSFSRRMTVTCIYFSITNPSTENRSVKITDINCFRSNLKVKKLIATDSSSPPVLKGLPKYDLNEYLLSKGESVLFPFAFPDKFNNYLNKTSSHLIQPKETILAGFFIVELGQFNNFDYCDVVIDDLLHPVSKKINEFTSLKPLGDEYKGSLLLIYDKLFDTLSEDVLFYRIPGRTISLPIDENTPISTNNIKTIIIGGNTTIPVIQFSSPDIQFGR